MSEKEYAPGRVEVPGAREAAEAVASVPPRPLSPMGQALNVEELIADVAAAMSFLERWRPGGPWVLMAIPSAETCTFQAGEQDTMASWVEARNSAGRNVYFMVNPAIGPLIKKAGKADVSELAWLHVDVDPRAREDFAAERRRIERMLRSYAPAPTVIVDSGGGFQAFWKLVEPVPIQGKERDAAEAEAYNVALSVALGGDNCHNCDRVMRLPGTINWPDERKRKKGRQPALARLSEFDEARVYGLEAFAKAPPLPKQLASDRAQIGAHSAFATVDDIAELQGDRWARLRALIVQGDDPLRDPPYPSRSEALFAAVCEMVRAGCPDETILAVILDSDFGISASVRDKSQPRKYAARQIEQARSTVAAEVTDPVEFINLRYFAALEGGKVAFYREEADGTVEAMQSTAFDFELAPYKMPVSDESGQVRQMIPYSKIWKSSPSRRYFSRGFVLDAQNDHDPRSYNLWKGFGIEPSAGEWPRLQAHINEVLADGNANLADYITRWAAWSFQNPSTPPRVALVFKGGEGIGKGAFCNAMVRSFGVHGMRVQNILHLTGRFNAHLRHCCLLFADEAVVPDGEHEGTLKGLITEPTVPIERKGVDVVQGDNHLHVVMASNNEWVIPAGIGARRFGVFKVSERRKGDSGYFAKLYAEVNGGGLGAMLYDLLRLDLTGWHPELARPETEALIDQKIRSLKAAERAWFDILLTGTLPLVSKRPDGFVRVGSVDLCEFMTRHLRNHVVTAQELAKLLGEEGMGFKQIESQRPRGFLLPSLDEARRAWNTKRFSVDWPVEVDDAGQPLPSAEWHEVPPKPF